MPESFERPRPAATASQEFWRGFRDISPLSLGVGAYGLAFGLLAASEGMSVLSTGVMSLFVFAGSAQIVVLQRLGADTGALLAVLAGLALNLRLVLMTASLRGELADRPWWQMLLGLHLTSDENWVLMHATRNSGEAAGYWYLVAGGSSLIAVWVISTSLGAAFAQSLPETLSDAINFAFTAAFVLLLTRLWRGRQNVRPWLLSAGVAIACASFSTLDPSWGLIAGALTGAVYAGVAGGD